MIKRLRALAPLLAIAFLAGCVPAQQYDALQARYQQLNASLSSEISGQQVRITRLQNALVLSINSDLLFPSGGWQMSAQAQQTIAKIAPILAPMQQTGVVVNGYTDNTPIGPELAAQGLRLT